MSHRTTQSAVPAMIVHIREHLQEALTIAKAAEICASDGYSERALTISLDIEDLLHSADNLLQAAATLNRAERGRGNREDREGGVPGD